MNRFDVISIDDEPAAAEEEPAQNELREHFLGVARSIWPRGTTIYCARCEQAHEAAPAQLATYLERGMPTCHGQPMRIGEPVLN